jgi:hypothetical protein
MKNLKALIKELNLLIKGIKYFQTTRETPEESYQALVSTYCKTSGVINECLHGLLKRKHPKQKIKLKNDLSKNISQTCRSADVARALKKEGLYVVNKAITKEEIEKIKTFAKILPAAVDPVPKDSDRFQKFDENNIIGEVYRYDGAKLIDCEEIQKLLCDNFILTSIQDYFGCIPVNSSINMWWSTNKIFRPDHLAANAQMYHFDMDRIKWVKVFFYLTDVSPGFGEHTFVKGSHKIGSQPKEFLRRGYARISDDDMKKHFANLRIQTITGDKGTMFFEDTRGYHKGAPVINGNRLVLEFEYADSLFGGGYKKVKIDSTRHQTLKLAKTLHPRIFERFYE